MSVIVGLDCGGSSSRVLAVNSEGEVLFQGHSGAANLISTPEARCRRNLGNASRGCPQADYVCGCFAGLISEDAHARGMDFLSEAFPGASVRAEPDYAAAFYASPTGTDITIIAGTGSLVCSKTKDGIRKSGGRGYLLGDAGSGFHYGKAALIHYLDHPQSCSEQLKEAVFEAFGAKDEPSLVSAVYRSQTPATQLAKLAKAFANDAKKGETYTKFAVERNTVDLAAVVTKHIGLFHADKDHIQICLAGGLWKAASVFKDALEHRLKEELPAVEIKLARIERPPLFGAIELAKEMMFEN